MNKKILILSGDPNSINSEIIYKSWKKISSALKKKKFTLFQTIIYLKNNFRG